MDRQPLQVAGQLAIAFEDALRVARGAVAQAGPVTLMLDEEAALEMAEDAIYAPYILRQEGELRDLRASDALKLGPSFPFEDVPGLSGEMVERLSVAAPDTLAAAARVRGVTPAALAAVLVYARRRAA